MYNDKTWEEFRAMVLADVKEREEILLKKWLADIGYKGIIGYYRNAGMKTMEIYATDIGVLIGKTGVSINKLEKMLTAEFHGIWEIKFIEIRGGFINI